MVTEITSINISDKLICYASKWKSNQIRIINLKDLSILKTWPNVKTKLDLISSLYLDNNWILIGDEKGHVSYYKLE